MHNAVLAIYCAFVSPTPCSSAALDNAAKKGAYAYAAFGKPQADWRGHAMVVHDAEAPKKNGTSGCRAVAKAHATEASSFALKLPRRRCASRAINPNKSESDHVAVVNAQAILASPREVKLPSMRNAAVAIDTKNSASDC